MFQSCIPNAVLEPPSNFFRAAYRPYRKRPPSHQLHTYTFQPSCTQPCMPNRISVFPNTAKYMYFLKSPISPILSSRVVYITPSLHPIQNFWLLHTCLSSVIINFNISVLLCFFYLSYPALPLYPLKNTLNLLNRRHTYLSSTSSREFEECPQQSGRPYLKEIQPEWKPDTYLFRETESVYFYLINVNLPSH